MSVQAMTWALEQRFITDPTARHVLLCLSNYADKTGRGAFPSAKSLAADTGLSERTVRYKLDHLQQMGAIRLGNQAIAAAYIDRHDRRPVCYDLALDRGAADAPRPSERGANEDTTGCSSQQNGVQFTTERGAGAAANPSLIHHLPTNDPEEPREEQAVDVDPTARHRLFEMFEDWQPDEKTLRAHLARSGLTLEHITPAVTADFVGYWTTRPTEDTHAGWCRRLVRRAVDLKAQGAAGVNTHESSAPRVSRPGAGIPLAQNLTDTSWAAGLEAQ